MHLNQIGLALAAVAFLAVAAVLALGGTTPDAILTGVLIAEGAAVDTAKLKEIVENLGDAWKQFKLRHDERVSTLEAEVGGLLLKAGRPSLGGLGSGGMTAEEHKAFELGVRALIAGDGTTAYQHFAQAKAMEAGVDPSGGYLVTPHFSAEMTKIMAQISPITNLARTIELREGSSFEEVVDKDTAEANWVGETQTRDDTDNPDLALFRCDLHELCAQPKVTQKLIDVTKVDVIAWLQGKVGEAFGAAESAAFHTGNGVGKPRGFLSYTTAATGDATRTWGQLEHVKTGANGAFATASASVNPADVLIDVISAMKAQYRNGARWLMSRATAGVVRKLKDADGRHVWVDSLVEGQPSVLLGYPVDISEDMPVIATDSLSIAFANWAKAYTIIRRFGVKFLPDPYTAKPYVKLYSTERVGGGVNNFEAIKLLKFSA